MCMADGLNQQAAAPAKGGVHQEFHPGHFNCGSGAPVALVLQKGSHHVHACARR